MLRKIFFSVLFLFFLLFLPQPAIAEETGFRFPTTCTTNGTSCDNMLMQDTNYNSWISTRYEDIIVTFTDFGVPKDTVIDDIQIKMRVRTSPNGGWTWFADASIDNCVTHYSQTNCLFASLPRCRYNTTTSFNSISSPTFTWHNNNSKQIVTGEDLDSPSFRLRLWQSTGTKNTDIDMLLLNVRYHDGKGQASPTPTPQASPTPTAVPTPTATPTPTPPPPFLDLPWDYEKKGLSFEQAALSINSYFDHTYPLLSAGLSESTSFLGQITTYENLKSTDLSYSKHDGYDYGTQAGAKLGNLQLAAASGWATYVNTCGACGNAIHIDHGNGYQTRYYHLQKDGLITAVPGQKIQVDAGQPIGKVGFSGNVIPQREGGAHIHFMVIEDKNKDGSFEDNIPDGVTDPFGWQSDEPDPWENYTFFYNGRQRTGNKSHYLWIKKLPGIKEAVPPSGGTYSVMDAKVEIDPDTFPEGATIEMKSSPVAKASDSIWSIGPTIDLTIKNLLGDTVMLLTKPVRIIWFPFDDPDISRFKLGTLKVYSSQDGVYWKEEQILDSYTPGAITTAVNHLTYFALMGERKDIAPPLTSTALQGERGQENWFRSDISLSLSATDTADEDPGGVAYTLYRMEGEDWQTYTSPLQFSDEGQYEISFYSEDNDGNVEDIKTVAFAIDKTPPVTSIDATPHDIWPPNGKMVNAAISGTSSDTYLATTKIKVLDEYHKIEPPITHFGQIVQLEAMRLGTDLDGRTYTIQASAEDLAGNTTIAETDVTVVHDQRK